MSEEWYPAADGPQVVGRFEWFDKLHVANSLAADQKQYAKIIILRHRVVGSPLDDGAATPMKEHNAEALKARFPQAWAAFQGDIPKVDGLLLSDPSVKLDGLDKSRVDLLKISGVMTLEQLAGLSDAQCQTAGFGTRTLRDLAVKEMKMRAEKANSTAAAFLAEQMEPKKNKGGRPVGSKNRPKTPEAA